MLVCNSWKQSIIGLKLVFGAGVIMSRKYEKCFLFDANIYHVGRSRQKKLWFTVSLEINTRHNKKLQKKIFFFWAIPKKVVNFVEINLWFEVSLRSNSPHHQRIKEVSCTPSQYSSFSTNGWK